MNKQKTFFNTGYPEKHQKMKKIITTAILFIALSAAAFAADKNKKLLNDLTEALKNSKQVSWSATETHKKASFNFNGQTVAAYYNTDDDALIGYSVHLPTTELSKATTDAIAKKYPDWQITESIMFIDGNGVTNNFVQLTKGKTNIAVKVSNDKLTYFGRSYIQ